MTAFTDTWNSTYLTLPADSEAAKLGAGRIRDLKNDITQRMVVNHSWAGDANDGAHLYITMMVQGSDPANAAGVGQFYTKTVSGHVELFYENEAGTVQQITSAGALIGNITGNVTGNVTGNLTGTASAATLAAQATELVGTIDSGVTGTTQTVNDSSTKIATTAFTNPASSIAANGYTKLPNGLILQWGSATSSGNGVPNTTITFPITFPTAVLNIQTCAFYNGGIYTASVDTRSTSGCTVGVGTSGGSGGSGVVVDWFAIGY